jgi:hypothetical protein
MFLLIRLTYVSKTLLERESKRGEVYLSTVKRFLNHLFSNPLIVCLYINYVYDFFSQ